MLKIAPAVPLIEPADRGYAPPSVTAGVSPAATDARLASILANISAYHIQVKPRAVVDQQDVPCCVSCALGAAMEVIHPEWPPLAPLFHYYVARYDNGGANSGGSLTLDRAIGALTSPGICSYDLHPLPYTIGATAQEPSPEAYTDAITRRITRRNGRFFLYRSFTGTSRVAWIRDQLRQNCPVVIGFRLPTGYPDSFLDRRFNWQDPEDPRPETGGHCVVMLGYDDTLPALRIQDSQGTGRFERGFWWMGYRVADSQVVEEVYSLVP